MEGQDWFLCLNLGPEHCENWLGEVPHLAPKGACMQMWGVRGTPLTHGKTSSCSQREQGMLGGELT